MFEGILLATAIFLGIPALALAVYVAIERYYDRQIRREPVACWSCGTNNLAALSIVNDTVTCANCHRDRVYAR